MLKDFSVQSLFMGCLTAFVGFASYVAVDMQGRQGLGATDFEAASGLMALSVAMGLCAIILSAATRLPISIAWSTPGAALLATTGVIEGGFPAAVGGFIICAILIIIATWAAWIVSQSIIMSLLTMFLAVAIAWLVTLGRNRRSGATPT